MTLKEFEEKVRDAFMFEVEYADECRFEFSLDGDGIPEGKLFLKFFQHEYELYLIVGEDGEPGIHTYDGNTIELSEESVFVSCLFKAHERIEALERDIREKH